MRVAGMGFQSTATPQTLRTALASVGAVDRVATAAPKVAALAQALGRDVESAEVAGISTPTMSQASLDAHGTGSVAEAAALVVAGSNARLLNTRKIIDGVTIAVVEGDGR